MRFRSKYRSERTKNRTAAATRKEAAATWYGRLVFAYAIWQFVALMLEYSAPAFVFESSRLLNVTNIPSYPSIVSFLLLTLIALGLLRRQRPALWMSVILWQGLSLVLSAVAGILIFLYPRLGGKTVAVSLNAAMQPFAPEMRDIMPKAVSGTATAEELKRFGELWQARVKAFLIDLADNPQFVIVREI